MPLTNFLHQLRADESQRVGLGDREPLGPATVGAVCLAVGGRVEATLIVPDAVTAAEGGGQQQRVALE